MLRLMLLLWTQIWLPDQSNAIFRAILATFPNQFGTRFACDAHVVADIARVCRLPIEIVRTVRKRFKPTPTAPMLLFSPTDVIKHLSLLLNVAADAAQDIVELEVLSLAFARLVFSSRSAANEQDALQQICLHAARRLHFDSQALAHAGDDNMDVLVADCSDSEGFARIPYATALELFRAGEERFHWYHKSTKESAAVDDLTAIAQIPRLSPTHAVHPGRPRILSSDASSATLVGTPSSVSIGFASTSAVSGPSSNKPHGDSPAEAQRRNSLVLAARKSTSQDKFTTPSPHLVRCMLDIYALLQDGVHNLLLCGSDTATRRSTTRIACGVHSFHCREIGSHVKLEDFVDALKAVVLDAGLKSTPTVLYLDCDFLSRDEFALAMETTMLHDAPARFYSAADRAQILAYEHQARAPYTATGGSPSKAMAGGDTASTNRESHASPSHALSSAFRENLKRCLYIALSFGYV